MLQLQLLRSRNPLLGRNVQRAKIVDSDSGPRVALTGIIAFYDFRLRFDVLLDTELLGGGHDTYSNLEGMCLGSTKKVVVLSSHLLFNPVLITRRPLQVPEVGFSGDDANACHTIETDTFRAIVEAMPAVYRITPRCLLLRITSPFDIQDNVLMALASFLRLRNDFFWRGGTADRRILQVAAEPELPTYWPDTFQLTVDHIHGDSEKQVFSLTATGYCIFAGLRLSCSRLFPFVIELDDEFIPHHLQKGLPLLPGVRFEPFISIEGISFPTNETIENAGEAMGTPGWQGLYNPSGVPVMARIDYE
jgi:hypothetical protein